MNEGIRQDKTELIKEAAVIANLLSISFEITKIRDKNDLISLINTKLKQLFYFNHSNIIAIDENRQTFSSFIRDPNSYLKNHERYDEFQIRRFSIHDKIMERILQQDDPYVIHVQDAFEKNELPEYLIMSYELGIKEIAAICLPGDGKAFGVLSFFSDRENSFNTDALKIIKGVGSQIATAISNILANESIIKNNLEKEMLLTLSADMARIRNKNELLSVINTKLRRLFYFTHSSVSTLSETGENFIIFLTDPESRSKQHPDYISLVTSTYPVRDGVFETFLTTEEPTVTDYETVMKMSRPPRYAVIHFEVGLREVVSIPLHSEGKNLGVLHFYSDRKGTFTSEKFGIIKGVANQVAIALSNIIANEKNTAQLEEIKRYKSQLELENLYLQQEINTAFNYSELIGNNPPMQRVYHLMSQVAQSGTTVLILGETGTGKELIARAIHNSSPQKSKVMVKVNCAALPANLIESELFGHERGSFTGALSRRIGKFELADSSTLFLDEIGELPVELQAKLLRAIQEKEIERLGGKTTIKVNVRVIAASNRDLQEEVNRGRFRSDLFYRLNVFPIILPPLRERKEDIPSLVNHFIARYARNAGKKITGISNKTMKELMAYNWPGNVRELEHLIERSVLLTEEGMISSVPIPKLSGTKYGTKELKEEAIKSFSEMEKDYIIRALKQCNGKVQGIGGAAEMLKIPPTTLHSKMKKLGIKKKFTS